MSNPSLVVVLLEDEHHKMLVYRYLIKRGMGRNEIRIKRSPSGNAEG